MKPSEVNIVFMIPLKAKDFLNTNNHPLNIEISVWADLLKVLRDNNLELLQKNLRKMEKVAS